jgi:hypothetical protein
MEYYIRSAGASPSQDYSWTKITRNEQKKQDPPLPPDIYKLIESEKFSAVLWRTEDDLLLLITGLQSSRTDYQGRTIRNSILWVGDDEQRLRAIAIFALSEQNKLQSEIDKIVKSSGNNEEGFIVTLSDIERVSEKSNQIKGSLAADEDKLIGHNSEKLRTDIVKTLQTKSLPKQLGGLVVVTELVPKQDLENAGVWRSLSTLVESENWEKVEPKPKSLPDIIFKTVTDYLNDNLSKILWIMPFVIIPTVLILGIFNDKIFKFNTDNCQTISSDKSDIESLIFKNIEEQSSSVKSWLLDRKKTPEYQIQRNSINPKKLDSNNIEIPKNFDNCK